MHFLGVIEFTHFIYDSQSDPKKNTNPLIRLHIFYLYKFNLQAYKLKKLKIEKIHT